MKREVVAKVVGCNMTLGFNYKPPIKERNAMKECHFRWSPDKGVWYGKSTPASRRMANSLKYIKDFVPAPKATEKDFDEWQRTLTPSEWDNIIHVANDEWLEKGGVSLEVLDSELRKRFMSQWA